MLCYFEEDIDALYTKHIFTFLRTAMGSRARTYALDVITGGGFGISKYTSFQKTRFI
jgi:hypothetical protein